MRRLAILLALLTQTTDGSVKGRTGDLQARLVGTLLADGDPRRRAGRSTPDGSANGECGPPPGFDDRSPEGHRLRLKIDSPPPHGTGDWYRTPGSGDRCESVNYFRHARPPRASAHAVV